MKVLLVIGSFILGSVGAWLMSRYACRIGLMDLPNERSSHSDSTPRGGGIGILLAFLLAGLFITKNYFFTILAGMIGLIGLLEDRFVILPKTRLLLQLFISTALVGFFVGLPTSIIAVMFFLFWIVFITGTANFYNFMDGINGIAGLTGMVGFGLITFAPFISNEPDIALMSLVLSVGCFGFLPFNFLKANVFMGDVGSILLGFVFASFVVKLSTSTSIFLCLIMFLCMFYADALVTIFYRWRRGENLMTAHRSHLYQYLCNELSLPHWKVSLTYAFIQFVIGVLAIEAYHKNLAWQVGVLTVFGIMFLITYKILKGMKPRLITFPEKELSL